MKEVKFLSIEPNLGIRYGDANPKKKVSFKNGMLVTSDKEEIEAVRTLISRKIIHGLKEIKFEEAPKKEVTKNEVTKKVNTKKEEPKKEEPKKEEPKKEEPKKEETENKFKINLK